ncbi:hypothetical protein KB20921_19460 [Edwardsiella ictaluri]|nr:YadA C-terminal domain-containing protein [Edwardsiella ictaluri]BEH99195.1 hypothetical protein KH20906_19230 [Edwardsiella ictaluri]BEI02685.1 hypothetical protein KB20921_19460 [Edwardsiella ictaluri]BEI06152.1 hypothetical protein KH201010_19380 [Edwardsiella ictaluri]BEI09609.1 hypothetical protein STU22726_19400 [Edwardsiella ictaluri]BEI13087.1 hypothetical protein STU22816_19400 [Edwardsiella ictaluri]
MWQIAAKDVALAGLFQPYSVGKFNASTALGYHKDQQDVSVRMGYHFTHQLMAKADAAFNDNSLECNVGINDEFNGVRPPACPETRAGIGHQRSRNELEVRS